MGKALLWGLLLLVTGCIGHVSPAQPAQPVNGTSAPNAPAAAPAVDQEPLRLDPSVLSNKLPNGLTYYVQTHTAPPKRAQLWLVVNAGSLFEDDDQRGLAHFIEHMAFNGTRRFPKLTLIDLLQKSGVRLAVIAVGDFMAPEMAKRIALRFASLAGPAKLRERRQVTLPPRSETAISIDSDPELPSASVAIYDQVAHRPETSATDYRRVLGEHLFVRMLNARLDAVRRQQDAPFLLAAASLGNPVRAVNVFRPAATVASDGALRGLRALRRRRYPFLGDLGRRELTREGPRLRRVALRDQRGSARRARYVRRGSATSFFFG